MMCCCEAGSGDAVESIYALKPDPLREEGILGLDQTQESPRPPHSLAKGGKVIVTFERPDGSEKDVIFQYRPLGMDCSGQEPIVVQRVRLMSPADRAEVKVNWVVRAVDGIRTPGSLLSLMQAKSSLLPQEPKQQKVVLKFLVSGEESQEFDLDFQYQPWGIMFTKSVPFRVKHVRPGSYSERLGVMKGWTLLKVDAEDIPERLAEAMDLIQAKVASLEELP
ncbi:unnamed protein product [Effrenium voratum]|nr:unnamed protein product [Effrenium voratum]CAJ1430252.1 unnamed protein product [Effrenium voratum]